MSLPEFSIPLPLLYPNPTKSLDTPGDDLAIIIAEVLNGKNGLAHQGQAFSILVRIRAVGLAAVNASP